MKIAETSALNFSRDNAPLFSVDSGEIMLFKTQDCFGGQITSEEQLISTIDFSCCNPAAGPIFIRDAEPGDVLAVDILDIKVAERGFSSTLAGIGPLWDTCELRTKLIGIKDEVAYFNDISWRINPMIGVIGTAPAEGDITCGHPGNYGGNMDCNKITKGARVYLPVRVAGALLQMGDLHATMGDGEIVGTGIEIAGEVTVRVSLIKGFTLNWPVVETTSWWYVNANAATCEDAMKLSLHELQRLLSDAYEWDLTDTAIYLSLQGSMEVNQSCLDKGLTNVMRAGAPKLLDKKPLLSL